MANIAISALPDATAGAGADEMVIVQSGTTKRLTLTELFASPRPIGATTPLAIAGTTYTGTGASTITPATDVGPLVLKGHVGATANLLDVQQSDTTSIFKVGVGAVATSVVAVGSTLEWSGTTGALTVAGGAYIAKKLMVVSDFAVNTNKFTVAGSTGNTTLAGTYTQTSADAAAFTVGRLGATTPAFKIDASTGTSITGVQIKSAAASGGVAILAIGETNVAMSVNGAGNGAMTLNTTSTGLSTLGNATGGVALAGAVTNTRSTSSASETCSVTIADTRTGPGATGWALKGELISNVQLGSYSNGIYGLVSLGDSGDVTGLSAGVCGEMLLSSGATAGTYAALEAELTANSAVALGANTSFMYFNIGGSNSTGKTTINTSAHFMHLDGGVVNTADGMFDEVTEQAVNAQARLRIKVGTAIWYIPLCDTSALS